MIVSKKIDFYVIFQVLLFNTISFLLLHVVLAPHVKMAMQAELFQSMTQKMSFLLLDNVVRSWLGRYVFLFSVLLLYYIFPRIFEKNKKYPPLLTNQPILYPTLLGLTCMCAVHGIALFISILFGTVAVVGYSESSFAFLAAALGIDLFIKLSNDLAEELQFRGYSITRLKEAVGQHGAVWLSALLFMLSHFYLPVPFLSYTTLHWFLYGLLFGYAFLITQSIYFTTGLHLGANVLVNQITQRWLLLKFGPMYQLIVTICVIIAILATAWWYEVRSRLRNK